VLNMSAGSAQTLTVPIADSASGNAIDAIASADLPRMLPPGGLWCGRLSQVGQTDWFAFPVRAGHTFTVVTQALNEASLPTETKALPAIGVWDAFQPISAASLNWAPALNGYATGETWLQVTASADDIVRLGIADMRGDGRPDYAYNGWVLYADTVQPPRLPASGGPIVIRGAGFRPSDTVLIGGQAAIITGISTNEITAIAPGVGITGSVDVEVHDLPMFYAMAIIPAGISYDAGDGDSLTLKTAPANTVPIGVPIPFAVTALSPSLTPAGGVTITFSVVSGDAILSCGAASCTTTATGDGMATINVTAPTSGASVVTASLTNGASLQAHFNGGTPPSLAAITPSISVAAGATVNWTTEALTLGNGVPIPGQTVTWQAGGGIVPTGSPTSTSTSNSSGIATKSLIVGPLAEGQQTASVACLNGTSQCVNFVALGARPEYAWLESVSGTNQILSTSGTPGVVTLRVRDMNGNPMVGGAVTFYQSLYAWAPPCPPHGRCAAAPLLATQTASAVSAIDGSVTFSPASIPGVATNLAGLAVTGNSVTMTITIEQHP
jgi:hypothetical protein